MPIRKTAKGWYWGSRGPFGSREKAAEVAQAAHASGYREHGQRAKRKPGWRMEKP